jgi:hypothetical protein
MHQSDFNGPGTRFYCSTEHIWELAHHDHIYGGTGTQLYQYQGSYFDNLHTPGSHVL